MADHGRNHRLALDVLKTGPATTWAASGRSLLGRSLGRLLRLVLLLVAVAAASFVLMINSPVDPVNAYVGADVAAIGPEQRAQIAERWGLNDSPLERFGSWLGQIAHGDLGQSLTFNQPVSQVIADKFLTSLALMAVAWSLSGVIGFGLGVLAGVRRGRFLDRAVCWWAYTLASAPTFWSGCCCSTGSRCRCSGRRCAARSRWGRSPTRSPCSTGCTTSSCRR